MPNFFTDNSDIQFYFNHLDIQEIASILEDDYSQAKKFRYAPVDYEDAVENYRKLLEIVGDIAGNFIAERPADVDEEGALLKDGRVIYAKGTQENLKRLAQADLMGLIFP